MLLSVHGSLLANSTVGHRMINDVLRTSRRHRPSTRACARHGVLDFEQKCLRTNVEFVSMTTVVRCPRTGRACRDHGGLSTGPRTVEGRTRIAETQRRRWRAFRDVSTRADAEKAAGELSGTVLERARSRVG